MKRVLVVDDERPVIDHIVRIIERELTGEFTVAGIASSGRETLETVPVVKPDILVMDVRMPGLSGLDTIRELRHRGVDPAVVLSTAYERFDIVREALELGVSGYLLKPVARDALVRSLRLAAARLDRETGRPQEDAAQMAAEAFLLGLMAGRGDARPLLARLQISKPWALVGAADFRRGTAADREALESALQYKSQALCGPLASGRCAIYLPLASLDEAEDAERRLAETVEQTFGGDYRSGRVRLGFAVRSVDELDGAWTEALARLARGRVGTAGRFAGSLEAAEDFEDALGQGDAARLRAALDAALAPFETAEPAPADRYGVIALLGAALVKLAASGHIDEPTARAALEFDDLRQAPEREFGLLARSRLPIITSALSRARRWSPALTEAVEYLGSHYGDAITLDLVAEAVGVAPKRLSRHFIEELGQGFSDYLIDLRIGKAKILLSLPGVSVKQISKECGYPDPNYFARLFKKVTGTTPSEFSSQV